MADTTIQVDCDFRKVIEFLNDLDEPKKEWQLFLHINKPQHDCWKERLERWRRKSEHDDKWSNCDITRARGPRKQVDHEQETTP